MSTEEARQTLRTLEQLIAVATWIGAREPEQRTALQALKRRRTVLRRLVSARHSLVSGPVVSLKAWRDPARATAATPHRVKPAGRGRAVAL
jgi:hypothetical protein